MPKKPTSAIDLSALEQAGTIHGRQTEQRAAECRQEYARQKQRQDAWGRLEPLLVGLAQTAGEGVDRAGLVKAFSNACDVLGAQQLGTELDTLDEEQMLAHYGDPKRWPPELTRAGYRVAVEVLAAGIGKAGRRALARQLAGLTATAEGRCVWSMLYTLLEGLLSERGWLFRKAPLPDPTIDTTKRPCYDRDRLWLEWSEQEGLGPAAIRDRWNSANRAQGRQKIGDGRAGCDVVKQALRKAQKERNRNA